MEQSVTGGKMDILQQPGSKNRILSAQQIQAVHEYVLSVMEDIGCKVECAEALDILGRIGCDVSDTARVKIPRQRVLEALEAAPDTIEVFDRDGNLAMVFKEDACYYGTGSDCNFTIDLTTGQRRLCEKQDIVNLTRFCDALENMDFVMSFGIANDTPDGTNFVHQYEAMLLNTSKPAIVTAHGRNDMETIIQMAAAAVGGVDKIQDQPPLILYTEPISPLVHTEMGVGKGLVCCEHGIPFIYIGSPMMGATSAVTIESTLVQTVAESLGGLVIFQNKTPGAKFIFGGDASVMDMKSTIFSYGSPELNILNAAFADMAHFYHLPFFCLAGATDAKGLDAQAGLEYALSVYNASLNGCNIIHDCGYLESGLTSSFESVLFSDELIDMVKFMLRRLNFDDHSVALDVIDKVGPGNHFLLEDHTYDNFKQNIYVPRYLDRKRFEEWQTAGSPGLRQQLNAKAREIFSKHQPRQLSGDIRSKIKTIIERHQPDEL
jgi:trimethylamine--corrinoid protein Co-methyltransferase